MTEQKTEAAAEDVKLVKMQKGDVVLEVHPTAVESHIAAGFTHYVEPEGGTLTGDLPADFPGADKLKAASITTFEQLEAVDDITTIEGIGAATAEKIVDALSKAKEAQAEKE